MVIMKTEASHAWFSMMLILLSFVSHSAASGCLFKFLVVTEDRRNAGTDANVSIGSPFFIEDLAEYGVKGPNYHYFERGSRDEFEYRVKGVPCWNPCELQISHDGSGVRPDWFLRYVVIKAYDESKHLKYQVRHDFRRWIRANEVATSDVCIQQNEAVIATAAATTTNSATSVPSTLHLQQSTAVA